MDRALVDLSALGRAAAARLAPAGDAPVSYAGGLFTDAWFAGAFAASVGAPPRVVAPRYPPEAGALLLAYRAAGSPAMPREPAA